MVPRSAFFAERRVENENDISSSLFWIGSGPTEEFSQSVKIQKRRVLFKRKKEV